MGSEIELINCFGDWLTKARIPPRLGRFCNYQLKICHHLIHVFMIACRHIYFKCLSRTRSWFSLSVTTSKPWKVKNMLLFYTFAFNDMPIFQWSRASNIQTTSKKCRVRCHESVPCFKPSPNVLPNVSWGAAKPGWRMHAALGVRSVLNSVYDFSEEVKIKPRCIETHWQGF